MGRFFGTDGIRGRAGDKLSPELVVRAAFGFTKVLRQGRRTYARHDRPWIIVGTDSRVSSPMLKAAVTSGLAFGGCDVVDLGTVPTPLVPFTLLEQQAAGGVMITASHNPIEDNGVKFFGGDGLKIGAQQERSIEDTINTPGRLKVPKEIGFGALQSMDAGPAYLKFLASSLRSRANGRAVKVLLDCAHGATCALAPRAFDQAGFAVDCIHDTFDGYQVNVKCGATDLLELGERVRNGRYEFGLAFDGDGDRVLAVDEKGRAVSGDKIIALMGTRLKRYRDQGAVVMTHMTNIGVELALNRRGVKMVRTEVGDINVLRTMNKRRLSLGGEQSGHIIMLDRLPGGDGILAGLQLAMVIRSAKRPLGDLVADFEEFPQVLTNLTVRDKLGWQDNKGFIRSLDALKSRYRDVRFYMRPSGTEDVVRVLTEAGDPGVCRTSNAEACALFLEWDKGRK